MTKSINNIGGHIGWYVYKAIEELGEKDLRAVARKVLSMAKEDGKIISSREIHDMPEKYVRGYLSWLKKEGYY